MKPAAFFAQQAFYRVAGWGLAASGDQLMRLVARPWRRDPYKLYAAMRAEPVYVSRSGMAAVANYDLCSQVLRDRRFGVRTTDGQMPPPLTSTPLRSRFRSVPSFLELDPPDHTALRGKARPAFSPAKIEAYRSSVEKTTERLMDAVLAKPRFDVVADVAAPLPISVISELLGVPDADAATFARYGRVLGSALDGGVRTLRHAYAMRTATTALRSLFSDLIEQRRRDPGEDVISSLAAEDIDPDDLLATCELLLVAGFETTTNLIANGVWLLSRHPEVWQRLRAEPDYAPAVVEEVLRFESPVQMTQRVAHEDLDLAGHRVRKDTFVAVMTASAARDPGVFPNPDVFDPSRGKTREHLAFSSGVHYCLGAPLARLEGEIALRALAEHLPTLTVVGRPSWRPTMVIRGLKSLVLDISDRSDFGTD